MKQLIIKGGQVSVEDVPAPLIEPGTVLVEVLNSCISIGTEMSGVKMSALPLWKRAMRQPENVKKVVESVASNGISRTMSMVKGKLAAGSPTGYSAAGRVVAVGVGVENFKAGDFVACAGAQCANHAEVIRVPQNLCAKVPENVSLECASTVTLGAIALQGVRRAQPTLGESFVVVGLGILGQITVQLLKANGCRVIGIDLDESRVEKALQMGMDVGTFKDLGSNIEQVSKLTDGYGADGVIITAATSSDEVISQAFQMTRKKGRVVLVGDVGLDLNRGDFYSKEIDFFISCSYGPGRYDNNYEEKGLDYPLPYVRWTENRNMSQYLHMISNNTLKVQPLVSKVYDLEQASQAYEELGGGSKALVVLLKYNKTAEYNKYESKFTNSFYEKIKETEVKLGIVGAGGFAKGMHLPNLAKLNSTYQLKAIVSRTGHNASSTAKQFNVEYASSNFEDVLKDKDVNALIIATRHDLHAKMALDALKAGKHVLLEKPLCLNRTELNTIKNYFLENKNTPQLLTGYNRRFSPYAVKIKEFLLKNKTPMIINYRMNAGYLNKDHWTHGPEGGGRNIGEACHIYDLFTYLVDSEFTEVNVSNLPIHGQYSNRDNFMAQFKFKDGSIANLIYTAVGNKDFPKEHLEIYQNGYVINMTDYKKLQTFGAHLELSHTASEKGQLEELVAFADNIKQGQWAIPLWQQIQVSEMSFAVEEKLK